MSETGNETRTHDFKAILLILAMKHVPCELNVAGQDMVDGEGTPYVLYFHKGIPEITRDDSFKPPLPEFDTNVYINDREIECTDEDASTNQIDIVRKHIMKLVSAVYGARVVHLRLRFGIERGTKSLYLTDGWVETAHNIFFDFLFRDYENAEQAFTELLCTEVILRQKQPQDVCFSGFDDCKEPKYRVEWLLIVAWRAHRMFPAVDGSRIYDVVKTRMSSIDSRLAKSEVPACICCVSLYAEEQQHHRHAETTNYGAKRTAPIFYEQMFEAQERAMGRERALHPDRPDNSPYCFNINFVRNPYRGKVPRPRAPLPPPDPHPIQKIPRPSSQIRRLMEGNYCVIATESISKGLRLSKTRGGPRLEPVKRTRQSYSEKRAAKIYGREPFSYTFINRRK